MQAWRFQAYRRPFLEAEVALTDGGAISLSGAGGQRLLAIDDPAAAAQIAARLGRLRDPGAEPWAAIRSGAAEPAWLALIEQIDLWSLVGDAEGDDGAARALDEAEAAAAAAVGAALAHVEDRLAGGAAAGLAATAARLLRGCAQDPECKAAWRDDNFYRAVIAIMLFRLKRAAPPSFAAALGLLRAIAGEAVPSGDAPGMAGFHSVAQMRIHLSAIADLLVRSATIAAARICPFVEAAAMPVSGTRFARDAERAMRRCAEATGERRFAAALAAIDSAASPLAIGCHVEEYHVTRRFVEMITPLLHMDLAEPLRALAYRYFAEEVGHERFERDTCASFGVAAEALAGACPLPLHVAFVDAFTAFAAIEPIGFLAAVPTTEGMLGEASPLTARLDALLPAEADAAYRRHGDLNLELNHASIARLALAGVAAVDPATQQRALDGLVLLFELNFRAWEALAGFYAGETLRLPIAFDPGLAADQAPFAVER